MGYSKCVVGGRHKTGGGEEEQPFKLHVRVQEQQTFPVKMDHTSGEYAGYATRNTSLEMYFSIFSHFVGVCRIDVCQLASLLSYQNALCKFRTTFSFCACLLLLCPEYQYTLNPWMLLLCCTHVNKKPSHCSL